MNRTEFDTVPYILTDCRSGMQVVQFSIPKHWKPEGQVYWNLSDPLNCATWEVNFSDGRNDMNFNIYSSLTSHFSCQRNMISLLEPVQFATTLCRNFFQRNQCYNIQLQKATYTPDENEGFQNKKRQMAMVLMNEFNMNRYTFDAIYYLSAQGRGYRHEVSAVVEITDARTMFSQYTIVTIMGITALTCPPDRESTVAAMAVPVLSSRKVNSKWEESVSRFASSTHRRQIGAARQNYQTVTQTQNEIHQMQQDCIQKHSQMMDRVNAGWSEAIRGVRRVENPYHSGSKVEVSNRYDHAWLNRNNEVIYSNDATYDPNRDDAVNSSEWNEL